MSTAPTMRVLSVARGQCAPLAHAGVRPGTDAPVLSAIRKLPCSTLAQPLAIAITPLGVSGDEQADLEKHGGPLKAVYAYPAEHYGWWETTRADAGVSAGAPLAYGELGENLTLEGLLEDALWVGDTLLIGNCILRVESPRRPCYKFNAVLGYRQAARDLLVSGRSGFYLSVQQPGEIRAGDTVCLTPGPRQTPLGEINRQRFAERRHELF
ncbi:MOSC domain-containing protein [Imbroritus primus]|uniref:MOSC domain-containing protein n=1 Tax=Imbroritus primus TaxID=3058603 RepID=A0ACD3SLH7_9BURK|nr:MOSC domain-containing protein [Burkholderiaceae bacterium PBA]